MVQIGEKDQGCKMINGVELQYPNANQSVLQKQNMSLRNLTASNKTHKILIKKLKDKKIFQLYEKFEKSLD